MHAAALKGFVRYGSRWGWKLGLFAGIFTMGRTLSSVYRNKDDVFNYVVAGSVTGGVFKVRHGIKPVIGGAFLGFLLSLPVGLCVRALELATFGRSGIEQRKLERDRLRRQKKDLW